MNIIIAGGSGFLGTKIIENFSQHNFINISKTNFTPLCQNNLALDLSEQVNHLNLSFSTKIDLIINCVDSKEKNSQDLRREIVESARNLIVLGKSVGCRRIIHFSINNVEKVKDEYQKAKLLAERAVENSNLEYAILRLSPIFGGDSQLDRLVFKFLQRRRVPLLGEEKDRVAPIHYLDVVRNLQALIENKTDWYQTFSLCGPEYVSFEELLNRYSKKKIRCFKTPNFMKKIYCQAFLDTYSKRVGRALFSSYFQDNKSKHSNIVKPLHFY